MKKKHGKGNAKNWIVVISIAAVFVFIIVLAFVGTAGGRRALVDIKSNFGGGLERIINIYTANGDLLASYTGKIDIAAADGGYLKFDYNGKRYIYYNCFIESIADIP